jgi:hypothetical protein
MYTGHGHGHVVTANVLAIPRCHNQGHIVTVTVAEFTHQQSDVRKVTVCEYHTHRASARAEYGLLVHGHGHGHGS